MVGRADAAQPRRLPAGLAVDDVERLIDEAPSSASDRRALALRDLAMVETAYAAGLRISELAAARLADLDLGRGELRVIGKGRKERVTLLGAPGARGARRLPARAGRAAWTAGAAPPESGVIFLNSQAARRSACAACATGSIG